MCRERALIEKKQMPKNRKENTNLSASETPEKLVRKATPVTPEKEAQPKR
jgi:hypothetical protein